MKRHTQRNSSHDVRRTIWDKTWKDRDGKVLMWQTPNAWLLSWAGLTVVSLFFRGHVANVFSWTASAALIIWSLLEIFSGVNYYRRVLGLAVLAYAAASLLKGL